LKKCEVSRLRLTSRIDWSLSVALLTTFSALATLLAALTTLASLLTLATTGFLSAALTASTLLTATLLTATLILFTIVCHDFLPLFVRLAVA